MTRAHNVAHRLLEDGPEDVNPKDFIDQYHREMQPEHYLEFPGRDFRHFVQRLEQAGVLQILRQKYDDDVIGYAIMQLVVDRSAFVHVRKAYLEMKRLARFQV